ncbi:MAG: sel1 repeat family protein [Proteobacteria bacterium]|nr:sel1 repeat family protein [Pseudomonadota bacterium]
MPRVHVSHHWRTPLRACAAALAVAGWALSPPSAWAQAAASTGAAAPSAAARATVTVGGTGAPSSAAATPITPAGATAAPGGDTGARYVESCQQAIERGVVNPGCQGPLYANEIARLKEDALRTNNPNLLTLLGDAYQSNRSGVSDIGQAYRWYLLGAVRGDPRAMQRLSELYKSGRGAPQDNIKALGYARLAQRLAVPGSASAKQATDTINSLGNEMAAEEVVLADRFASELETKLRSQQGAAPGTASAGSPAMVPAPAGGPAPGGGANISRLPGMGAVQAQSAPPAPAAASPLGGLPGQESLTPRSTP